MNRTHKKKKSELFHPKPKVPAAPRVSRGPSTSSAKKIAQAYSLLKIDPQQVVDTPKITHILGKLPGGIKRAIEFLRGDNSDEARKLLALYDDIPSSLKRMLPFEAYCVACGITTKRIMEIITGACFEQSALTSKLLAAANHPSVVQATVRSARTLDGHQDRKMMHLHTGFVPVPKNQATFIGKGGIGTQVNAQITDNSTQTTYSIGEIQGIEKRQERIADRFNDRYGAGSARELPPATMEPQAHQAEPEPDVLTIEQEDIEILEPDLEPTNDWSG